MDTSTAPTVVGCETAHQALIRRMLEDAVVQHTSPTSAPQPTLHLQEPNSSAQTYGPALSLSEEAKLHDIGEDAHSGAEKPNTSHRTPSPNITTGIPSDRKHAQQILTARVNKIDKVLKSHKARAGASMIDLRCKVSELVACLDRLEARLEVHREASLAEIKGKASVDTSLRDLDFDVREQLARLDRLGSRVEASRVDNEGELVTKQAFAELEGRVAMLEGSWRNDVSDPPRVEPSFPGFVFGGFDPAEFNPFPREGSAYASARVGRARSRSTVGCNSSVSVAHGPSRRTASDSDRVGRSPPVSSCPPSIVRSCFSSPVRRSVSDAPRVGRSRSRPGSSRHSILIPAHRPDFNYGDERFMHYDQIHWTPEHDKKLFTEIAIALGLSKSSIEELLEKARPGSLHRSVCGDESGRRSGSRESLRRVRPYTPSFDYFGGLSSPMYTCRPPSIPGSDLRSPTSTPKGSIDKPTVEDHKTWLSYYDGSELTKLRCQFQDAEWRRFTQKLKKGPYKDNCFVQRLLAKFESIRERQLMEITFDPYDEWAYLVNGDYGQEDFDGEPMREVLDYCHRQYAELLKRRHRKGARKGSSRQKSDVKDQKTSSPTTTDHTDSDTCIAKPAISQKARESGSENAMSVKSSPQKASCEVTCEFDNESVMSSKSPSQRPSSQNAPESDNESAMHAPRSPPKSFSQTSVIPRHSFGRGRGRGRVSASATSSHVSPPPPHPDSNSNLLFPSPPSPSLKTPRGTSPTSKVAAGPSQEAGSESDGAESGVGIDGYESDWQFVDADDEMSDECTFWTAHLNLSRASDCLGQRGVALVTGANRR